MIAEKIDIDHCLNVIVWAIFEFSPEPLRAKDFKQTLHAGAGSQDGLLPVHR